MNTVIVLSIVAGLEAVAVVTLGILLTISQQKLKGARRSLAAARTGRRRRGRLAPAQFLLRTAWKTADAVRTQGFPSLVRTSIEDLAGWAQVERPDLARLCAGGDVVIAFSDIEDSTRRNSELGDRDWVKLLDRHTKLVQTVVADNNGQVIKSQGDGFMMAFPDAERAAAAALAIQQTLESDPDQWQHIRVRIGAHVGPSVRRGDDLFGVHVATASRVAGQAAGGETLISEPLREVLLDDPELAIGAPREVELKGLVGAHKLYPITAAS